MDSGSRASAARRAIVEAYIDLMEEKPYDSIRVKELVQRSNVARSTFYVHFRDAIDVLEGIEGTLLGLLSLYRSDGDAYKGDVYKRQPLRPPEEAPDAARAPSARGDVPSPDAGNAAVAALLSFRGELFLLSVVFGLAYCLGISLSIMSNSLEFIWLSLCVPGIFLVLYSVFLKDRVSVRVLLTLLFPIAAFLCN